jgi:hypothetical protein
MNDKLKSVLKLIVSLGLGVFLILYFYNQISKPKDFIVNKKIYKDFSTIQKLNINNNTYFKVGDTILFYNNGIPLLAETEATYQINSQSSTNEKSIWQCYLVLVSDIFICFFDESCIAFTKMAHDVAATRI